MHVTSKLNDIWEHTLTEMLGNDSRMLLITMTLLSTMAPQALCFQT